MTHNQRLIDSESKIHPKWLCSGSTFRQVFVQLKVKLHYLYISEVGWSSHKDWVKLHFKRVKVNLNAEFVASAKHNGLGCTLCLPLKEFRNVLLGPKKEQFHLLLALCSPSLQFCYAQLSKQGEQQDIRSQHLSPNTHKPLSFGSFSVFARDYLLTLWLPRQTTQQLWC